MYGAVCGLRESLIVGDNDEGLSELISEVEKELVELCFVFGVE